MKQLIFRRGKTDLCLFNTDLENGDCIYVLVYVDDCIVLKPKKESEAFVEDTCFKTWIDRATCQRHVQEVTNTHGMLMNLGSNRIQ